MLHIASDSSKSFLHSLDEKAISPNAVDLRLEKVFKILDNTFVLDDEFKSHRGTSLLEPEMDGYWHLWPGSYEIVLGNITIGPDEAGFVLPRSTLNRNGVFITTGLYDSGYVGAMGACLHVTGSLFKVKPNTRVAQFILFKAEALHQYDGSYGFKNGVAKPEEVKYHKE